MSQPPTGSEQPQYPAGPYPPPYQPTLPRHSKGKIIGLIIGVMGLVLLLGGGILTWLLTRDNDEGTKDSIPDSGSASETVKQYFEAIVAQDEKELAELSCKEDRAEFIENGSWRQAYENVEGFSVNVKDETKKSDHWVVDFSYTATIEGVETEGNQSVQVVKEKGAYKVCVSQTLGLSNS